MPDKLICKHENHWLMGTADGVLCRKCGKLFANFDELYKDIAPEPVQEVEKPAPKPRTRKKKGEA